DLPPAGLHELDHADPPAASDRTHSGSEGSGRLALALAVLTMTTDGALTRPLGGGSRGGRLPVTSSPPVSMWLRPRDAPARPPVPRPGVGGCGDAPRIGLLARRSTLLAAFPRQNASVADSQPLPADSCATAPDSHRLPVHPWAFHLYEQHMAPGGNLGGVAGQ